MELLLIWIGLSLLVGFIAGQRGRSGFGWFLLSLILSPLIAAIALALIPTRGTTRSGGAQSLESQVRDRMLEQQYAPYIRGHKPALSNSFVFDVNIGGSRQRFRTKAEAIAYCMSMMPPAAPPDHQLTDMRPLIGRNARN